MQCLKHFWFMSPFQLLKPIHCDIPFSYSVFRALHPWKAPRSQVRLVSEAPSSMVSYHVASLHNTVTIVNACCFSLHGPGPLCFLALQTISSCSDEGSVEQSRLLFSMGTWRVKTHTNGVQPQIFDPPTQQMEKKAVGGVYARCSMEMSLYIDIQPLLHKCIIG